LTTLSIIIPVYNEEERLPKTLDVIKSWVQTSKLDLIELLIVDDGSTDSTIEVIKSYQSSIKCIRYIKANHQGAMGAKFIGYQNSTAQIIVSMEADCSVKPSDIDRLLSIHSKFDVIIGSRLIKSKYTKVYGKSFFRNLLSILYSLIFRALFDVKVLDPQIGFTIYKKYVLDKVQALVNLEHDGLKSSELILRSIANGFQVIDVPVNYYHDNNSRCVPSSIPILILLKAFMAIILLWINLGSDFIHRKHAVNVVRFFWIFKYWNKIL